MTLRQLDELPRDAPTLVIMQGCPGQGKTTEANKMKNKLEERGLKVAIFSTDDVFTNANGEYEFVPYAIGAAHAFTQHEMIISMEEREEQVYILDNTNLQRWEYLPYLRAAKRLKYRVFVLDLRYKEVNENIHGVPEGKVKMMLENSDKPYPAHIEKYYAMNQDWYDWIFLSSTNYEFLERLIAARGYSE